MSGLVRGLVWLAALAFVVAVITTFTGSISSMTAEGASRACTNLAVLAIAFMLLEKKGGAAT